MGRGQFELIGRLWSGEMGRGIHAGSIVAALAVIGTCFGAGDEARADLGLAGSMHGDASTHGSLTIGGGVVQNGDPSYTYQLEVFLSGSIYSGYSTSFGFGPLVGVDSSSATSILNQYTASGVSWTPSITPASPPTADGYNQSDVTWTYSGSALITSGGPSSSLLLGVFQVTTDPAYSSTLPGGYPSFLTNGVTYSWTLDGGSSSANGSSGPITFQQGGVLAPEPSTAIAPLCVIAALPIVWFVRVRLRRRQRAAA